MAREPKYLEIRNAIREHIRTHYAVGAKIPSTTQLHEMFDVSQGTISRAIRDLVDQGLVERFEGRGTFVSCGNKNRGFLWPAGREWSLDSYPSGVIHAAEQESYRRGRQLLVSAVRSSSQTEFADKNGSKVAGVIILFNANHEVVRAYQKEHIPVVLADPFVRTIGVPFVTSDHFSAGRETTIYLARQGHRRIVHVTIDFPHTALPMEERILGYKEAMRENGLDEYVHVHSLTAQETDLQSDGEARCSSAEESFLEMVRELRPTACCCFDDLVALKIIQICHDSGIRIPDDLSLVGINDGGMAEHVWPPLTTIHIPGEEIGRAAVRMLDQLIDEGRLTGTGETLPVHLVERASTRTPDNAGISARVVKQAFVVGSSSNHSVTKKKGNGKRKEAGDKKQTRRE